MKIKLINADSVKKKETDMKKEIDFGKDNITKILLRLAPPVVLAQLIQALYNIIDSLFVGKCSENGLTALSIIYPIQLLMIAIAVGTGVGINTGIAKYNGLGKLKKSKELAGIGTPLSLVMWFLFAVVMWFVIPFYVKLQTNSADIIKQSVIYGKIVCVFSIGLFAESTWTKIHQADGHMKLPMVAQIIGAVINIILDPLLIFGYLGFPTLGIAGAAIATVVGQIAAALIVMYKAVVKPPHLFKFYHHTKDIFRMGFPNILMQSAYTFYIFGLNMILAGFSDQAVTALGLYYKWQTIFFIPFGALQTCIVPVLSFNYARNEMKRCSKTLIVSIILGTALMFTGTICFWAIPSQMLGVFTSDPEVIRIGSWGLKIVGISFLGIVTSLIFPVFFQATEHPVISSLLTVLRTIVLFVPLAYVFSRFGLKWFWFTFPVTEAITSFSGFFLYKKYFRKNKSSETKI